jgi:hypothetical protein
MDHLHAITLSDFLANMTLKSSSGFNNMNNNNHRNMLISVGISIASSMRTNSRDQGVPGISDFLNGIMTACLMLEKSIEGSEYFIPIFEEEAMRIDDVLSSKGYRSDKSILEAHILGEVVGDRLSQSSDVALSAEAVVKDIAEDLSATKDDVMRIMSFCVIAIVCAVSAPENREGHLTSVIQALIEKHQAAELVASMNDD